MRSTSMGAVLLAALAAAACSGGDGGGGGTDGGTGPAGPSAMAAAGGDNQTAAVGTAVPVPPAVRVTNGRGQAVANVAVTFTVGAGGGSVSGGAATTDANGVATVGGWTLGTAPGANTLVASVPGLQGVTFTGTAVHGSVASLARIGGDGQSGEVGTALGDSLAVRAADAFGNPVDNVTVTFAVSGGGSVSPVTATTGAGGIARTRLTLGSVAGPTSVTATAGAVTSGAFSATARPGPAAAMVKTAGDNQTVAAGRAVPVPPVVRLTDRFGNAVPGGMVTFSPALGGGVVTGPSVGTDAAGSAAVGGWTLGTAYGTNTLLATSGALSTTFTATAANPCSLAYAYAFGGALSSSLDGLDCRLSSGQAIRFYSTSLSSATDAVYTLRSGSFDAVLYLFDAGGNLVAADDDGGGATDSRVHVYAPAGSYLVGTSTFGSNQAGGFTLSSQYGSQNTGCEEPWAVPGITTNQSLQSSDCVSGSAYGDYYFVWLRTGQTITVTQRSTVFDTYLQLYGPSGSLVAYNDDGAGGTDSRIVYTASTTGAYAFFATSFYGLVVGSYSITFQ